MNNNSYCLINYNGGVLGCGISDNKLIDISYEKNDNENIGNIYVAKVTDIVANINSAFISYQPNKKGYLSLKEITNPVLLNRKFDGKLRQGDELLVSLQTERIRTKDPVFTTNLSLAGKYCVVSNENTRKTISSKINDKYKNDLLELMPDDIQYGIIIRTNALETFLDGEGKLIADEIAFLSKKLEDIINTGIHRTIYSCVYEAPGAYLTALRDNGYSYDKVVTDDMDIYNKLKAFTSIYMSEMSNKLEFYNNESFSLMNVYSIQTKLEELLDKKVWLKSGAYLIIEQTEAMYVIDVNSGKNISKKDNSEYVYSINLEAAKEIARQLRLRNMSGMILVDFINMGSKELEDRLFKEISGFVKQDSVKTIIVDYTKLGLLEITRKKVKKSLNCQLNS